MSETNKILLALIEQHKQNTEDLKKEGAWITSEQCMDAIKEDGMNIKQVIDEMYVPILLAPSLVHVPQNPTTEESGLPVKSNPFCFAAVRQNGMALEHIPEPHRSLVICRAAVSQNPEAIEFVPPKVTIQDASNQIDLGEEYRWKEDHSSNKSSEDIALDALLPENEETTSTNEEGLGESSNGDTGSSPGYGSSFGRSSYFELPISYLFSITLSASLIGGFAGLRALAVFFSGDKYFWYSFGKSWYPYRFSGFSEQLGTIPLAFGSICLIIVYFIALIWYLDY
ncbi:MAG: DUF4116 domain-containing protein [SAR324 cluster bacterium]|nr:DUF4116 domain-containing protein [SAR324 cluster bacterium]